MSKRINKDEVDRFHDYSIYIPKRTLYMGSEEISIEHGESGTDGAMAERIIKNLIILEGMSSEPITIVMNNIGGDEYHGFAVYDAIRACKSRVTISVIGYAMSMGSVILQAADERIMAPTSRQMIHYGKWGVDDHAKNSQKWAEERLKMDGHVEQLYLSKIKEKNPDFTLKRLQKMLNFDTFLSAEESVELGLADKVAGDSNE